MKRKNKKKNKVSPNILLLDIETAPIIAYVWSLWDQNIGLNQIEKDWHVLSWSAKWYDDPASKIMYKDQRKSKDISDDSAILKIMWHLLDKADVVVTHNGIKFDRKKLNARFILNGMKQPSPYKMIDTLVIAKKHFGFTSNKLEYLSNNLCNKYKKLTKKRKFHGFELWRECLRNNKRAWNEMREYNNLDVLALEELFEKLYPWENNINFNLYNEDGAPHLCNCGSAKIKKNGNAFTSTGKFQRYMCTDCGAYMRDQVNLISKNDRKKRKVKVT